MSTEPSNQEFEERVNSEYFDYLVNKKLNEVVREKYAYYKGLILSGVSILTLGMGYIGYNGYHNIELLESNREDVALLNHKLDSIENVSEQFFQNFELNAQHAFRANRDTFSTYISSISAQQKNVDAQNDYLKYIIASNQQNFKDKSEIFSERVRTINNNHDDVKKAKHEVEGMLVTYRQRLEMLDSAEIIQELETVRNINERVNYLELDKDWIFSLHEAEPKLIETHDGMHEFVCVNIKSDFCRFTVNSDVVEMAKGDDLYTLTTDNGRLYIELVYASRGGIFGKPSATFKVSYDYTAS